jgi:hypothetical protein
VYQRGSLHGLQNPVDGISMLLQSQARRHHFPEDLNLYPLNYSKNIMVLMFVFSLYTSSGVGTI